MTWLSEQASRSERYRQVQQRRVAFEADIAERVRRLGFIVIAGEVLREYYPDVDGFTELALALDGHRPEMTGEECFKWFLECNQFHAETDYSNPMDYRVRIAPRERGQE